MSAERSSRFADRLSAIGLIVWASWTLVVPAGGVVAGPSSAVNTALFTVAGGLTLFLTSWKHHLATFGITAVALFQASIYGATDQHPIMYSPTSQTIFIAIFGFLLSGWSESGHLGNGRFWLSAFCGLTTFSTCLWLCAEQAGTMLSSEMIRMADEGRMLVAALVMMPTAGMFGTVYGRKGTGRWICFAVGVLAPAAGFGIARAFGFVDPVKPFSLGQWDRWMSDWQIWLSQKEIIAACRSWCWATPYAVLPLTALGLWRAFSRGFRQRRAGEAPLGWLVFLTSVLLLAVLVPSSGPTHAPPILLWLTVLLSVFGVADLGLFVVEQLRLPPPQT